MDALNTHEIYWRSLKISSLQEVKLTSNGFFPDQEEFLFRSLDDTAEPHKPSHLPIELSGPVKSGCYDPDWDFLVM